MIVSEHGKVYEDAKGSLTRGLEVVEFACGIPHLLKGEFTENVGRGVDSWSMRQPLGVCAGITPFNFPAMVPMWMFPVAIACGNTFILKPSEKDPSCSMMLANLLKQAGLPDGVFNVLIGDGQVGAQLSEDKRIAKISLTGSVQTGKDVMHCAANTLKPCTMELGGKSPLIICEDAHIEHAVQASLIGNFYTQGEVCSNATRVYVHKSIYKKFIERVVHKTKAIKIGNPMDKSTQMGAFSVCYLERAGFILPRCSRMGL